MDWLKLALGLAGAAVAGYAGYKLYKHIKLKRADEASITEVTRNKVNSDENLKILIKEAKKSRGDHNYGIQDAWSISADVEERNNNEVIAQLEIEADECYVRKGQVIYC